MLGYLILTAAKAWLAARGGMTADITQTWVQAQAFLSGADVLDPAATGQNPSFFPMGHYLIAAACARLAAAGGTFAWWLKLPAIGADLAIAWLLARQGPPGRRLGWAYLLSPITFLLAVYHGQLHTVATAFALAALLAAARGQQAWAGLLLAAAVSVRQHYAALLLPLWWGAAPRRPWRLAAVFGLAVLAANAPLLWAARPDRLLTPTWTFGTWGYTLVLAQGPRLLRLAGFEFGVPAWQAAAEALLRHGGLIYLGWLAVFAAWCWRTQPRDLWRASLFWLLGLYVVSPGFGVQWLGWAVPFWLLVNAREAWGFSILGGLYLAGSYWQATLNRAYAVESVTANLQALRPQDLAGLMLVGLLGFVTWAYCARAAWRLR